MNSLQTIIASNTLNKKLAGILKKMSDCYKYMGPEQRFRAFAYDNASKTIANMVETIDKYNHRFAELDKLKGIGKSIAEKILEFLETGEIKAYEKLKSNIPIELLDLMNIEGIGPATVRLLHDSLNVSTKAELIEAVRKNKLSQVKGIGKQKTELIIHALDLNADIKSRIPLEEAKKIASQILVQIKKTEGVIFASLAGSIRREKETIGDIDVLIAAPKKNQKLIAKSLTQLKFIKKVLISGATKISFILKDKDIQCDIRIVERDEYGSALLYFTGPKEHNILLRSIAKKKGLKINEYGVFEKASGKKIAGKTEESVYKSLGLSFIEPKYRTGHLPDK